MGFKTMHEGDCLVRKALGQFKWADAEGCFEGQGAVTGAKAAVQDAVEAAKAGGLSTPVVKVGTVGKNLVFRIKHAGGHWGKDDVILVRNYVRAAPDDGAVTRAMLKSSKKKDMLTVAWWNDVRGDMDPGALGRALTAYESFLTGTANQESLVTLASAADTYVGPIERAAADLRSRLAHKDDQGLLGRLENAASQGRETIGARLSDYSKRLARAVKQAADVVASRKDGLSDSVRRSQESIARRDFDKMYQDYTRAKQSAMRENPDGVIGTAARDAATTEKVDPAEVLSAVEKSSGARAYREAVKTLPAVCRELLEDIDELEEGRDSDADHPDRTTSQDPTYRKAIVDLSRDYKEVFTALSGAAKLSKEFGVAASKLVSVVPALKQYDARVAQGIVTILGRLKTLYTRTVETYSGIRSESGAVKKRVAEAGVTTEDKAKFLTPVLNKCMARWYDYREAEAAVFEHAEAVASALTEKFAEAAAGDVGEIRAALVEGKKRKD